MCTVDGCNGKVAARGWCRKHYMRWYIHGDPLAVHRPGWDLTHEQRFWSQVDKTGDCWTWTGPTYKGYGRFESPVGGLAHRYSFWLAHGQMNDLTVDHECHNLDLTCLGGVVCAHRRCVRPSHLLQRPSAENVHRGHRRGPTCPNGHPYPAVASRQPSRQRHSGRRCEVCYRESLDRSNEQRRTGVRPGEYNRSKTHCKSGHAFDSANTYITREGFRACRACARERNRRDRERKRSPHA